MQNSIAKHFSQRSIKNLAGVHADLIRVANAALAISLVQFEVTEGLRTKEKQAENLKKGASQTKNSRHLDGHAIDVVAIVDGRASWDWKYYEQIAAAFKRAATELGVLVEWGGDWVTLKDGCHFQLSRKTYK
jgi:peptidoglycan L-alanyl-D-glutamate endopeptidase CwlK